MNEKIKNIIGTISFILCFLSVIMLVATAGSVDMDPQNLGGAITHGIIWLIILAISTGAIVLIERDEDKYGRL